MRTFIIPIIVRKCMQHPVNYYAPFLITYIQWMTWGKGGFRYKMFYLNFVFTQPLLNQV